MIGGYKTHYAGVCPFEGVKTRRMLHAPVSLDFKHTLRSYMTRNSLDLRREIVVDKMPGLNGMEIIVFVDLQFPWRRFVQSFTVNPELSQKFSVDLLNVQINQMTDDVLRRANIPAKAGLIREYNRQRIHCYTRNRERFATATVKMA